MPSSLGGYRCSIKTTINNLISSVLLCRLLLLLLLLWFRLHLRCEGLLSRHTGPGLCCYNRIYSFVTIEIKGERAAYDMSHINGRKFKPALNFNCTPKSYFYDIQTALIRVFIWSVDKMTKGNVKGVSNVMTPGGIITKLHFYTCNRQLISSDELNLSSTQQICT